MGLLHKENKVKPLAVSTDVLILGCSGAGKTLLVRSMKRATQGIDAKFRIGYETTTGVEIDKITFHKTTISMREVGAPMKDMWDSYLLDCRLILYVVDSSNATQISESIVELYSILRSEKTQGLTVFIIFNKSDALHRMDSGLFKIMARFEDLGKTCSQNLNFLEVSALTGNRVEELLECVLDAKTKIRGFHGHS